MLKLRLDAVILEVDCNGSAEMKQLFEQIRDWFI